MFKWLKKFLPCTHDAVKVVLHETRTLRADIGGHIIQRNRPFRMRWITVNCARCGVVIDSLETDPKWTGIKENS